MKNAADVPAFAPSLRATTFPPPPADITKKYRAASHPIKKENKSGLTPFGYYL
jgi:hypothetical protein